MRTFHRIISAAVIFTGVFFASCKSESEQDKDNNAILSDQYRRDSALIACISTLDEIDSNLNAIRDSKGLITLGPKSNVEEGVTQREHILRNIAMINDLLTENQRKIKSLQDALTASGSKNKSMAALTKSYEQKIADSQQEIADLKKELQELAYSNEDLSLTTAQLRAENAALLSHQDTLNKRIADMDNTMHTGWYKIGTAKDLQKEKLIGRKNIFAQRKAAVLTGDFDQSVFTKVNTRSEMTIALGAKKAILVTSHPANSYSLERTAAGTLQLHIKDPERFWAVSRYLVVETKA